MFSNSCEGHTDAMRVSVGEIQEPWQAPKEMEIA